LSAELDHVLNGLRESSFESSVERLADAVRQAAFFEPCRQPLLELRIENRQEFEVKQSVSRGGARLSRGRMKLERAILVGVWRPVTRPSRVVKERPIAGARRFQF
jgi:hypothetical protein